MRTERRRIRMRLRWPVIAAAVCTALSLPAAALAATANVRIERVWYTAAAGETNSLTISFSGSDYVLTDPGANIAASAGCSGGGNTATCPAAGIRGFTVN